MVWMWLRELWQWMFGWLGRRADRPAAMSKTRAFCVDGHGGPGNQQLLGWLVPVQGTQRGELFALLPTTTIGTARACTICLADPFVSGRHLEIKAESGVWVARDNGSTNGSYINGRRIDRHELVDNDILQLGGAVVKFKSL
jgi:hypothetical protein